MKQGRDSSARNVARAGLRLLEKQEAKRAALRAALIEGEQSGPSTPFDFEDILSLMQVTGMKEKSDILRFASRFYPEARTSGKLVLAIDHLWTEYSRQRERPVHETPRYLGRSGPEG